MFWLFRVPAPSAFWKGRALVFSPFHDQRIDPVHGRRALDQEPKTTYPSKTARGRPPENSTPKSAPLTLSFESGGILRSPWRPQNDDQRTFSASYSARRKGMNPVLATRCV